MQKTEANSEPELLQPPEFDEFERDTEEEAAARARRIAQLRLLWEKRRFLFRVTAYGLLIATLIAFALPKRYESTARLMPPDSQSSSGLAMAAMLAGRTGGLGGLAGDLLGIKSTGALFVGLMRSRTIEDRVIEEFDLRKVYGAGRIEDVRAGLENHTQISEDRKSGIITITVTDKDPQRATAIAKAYVGELDRLVAEVSTSAARRERVFLEERLKAVKQELDTAAKEFSQFASKNTAIDIQQQGKSMVEAAATLQGQLITAQTELKMLEQIYNDNNVRVRAARARVTELQRSLEKLMGKEAVADGSPGTDSDLLYPSIRELPLLGVTYADLYRRSKIAEVVYELLTQQYELAKVQEAKEIPTVKVVDLPVVPEKKSFPPRLVIMFLGMCLSLALGMVWTLGSRLWAETESQDPGKVLAHEVFTTVKSQLPWASQNGSSIRSISVGLWRRFRRQGNRPDQRE